jgi:putative oxidoreductase
MNGLGLLLLRLTVATVLVAHGAHDLFGIFASSGAGPGGLARTAQHFTSLGLTSGTGLAALTGVLQLIGGGLVGIGVLTRWASISLIVYVGFLIWEEHWRWGFFLNWMSDPARGQGMEYAIVLIRALGCLALAGGGAFSIDGRRARSAATRAEGRARVRRR